MKHFRQIVRPATEDEAVRLREAIGTKALYIAGGTTVVPIAGKSVEVLIDISRLGLAGIGIDARSISIGATTKLAALLSPEVRSGAPVVSEALRRCATPIIRNMATLGGSLAGIYLPSDVGVALLALGADIEIKRNGMRVVAAGQLLAEGWLSGPDLIRRVRVRKLEDREGASFTKAGRGEVDIALVSVAAAIKVSDGDKLDRLTLAVGQTLSLPVLVTDIADEGKGKKISHGLIENLADIVSDRVKPKSDFRASSDYRKHLIRVLAARSILAAAKEAGVKVES